MVCSDLLDRLGSRGNPVAVHIGNPVVSESEAATAFYLVRSGRLRVLRRDRDGVDRTVGCLFPGDHFGEGALLRDRPHRATVRATESCELLEVSRADFLRTTSACPDLKARLEEGVDLVAYRDFTRHIRSGLEGNHLDAFQEMLGDLEKIDLPAGRPVVSHGALVDKVYLIASGHLEAEPRESGNGHRGVSIGPGTCLGVSSVVDSVPEVAGVTAVTEVVAFRLSESGARRTAIRAPLLIEALRLCEPGSPREGVSGAVPDGSAGSSISVGRAGDSQTSRASDGGPRTRAKGKARKVVTARRFPFIKQQDASDCGAACLGMICKHYRVPIPLGRLRDLAGVSRDGASMAGLAEAAEAVGFVTRGVRTGYDQLLRAGLPAILHWQGNHFVVLVSVDGRKARIADPAVGVRTLLRPELEAGWTHAALLVENTDRVDQKESSRSTFGRFLPLVSPHAGVLFEVLLASVLLSLFGLASPVFTQAIIDRVLVHQDQDLLNLMLIGMGVVATFQIVTGVVRTYLIASVSARLSVAMLSGFYRHLLALPMRFFATRRTGDLTTRFAEHAGIQSLLTGATVSALLDILMLFVYLGLMLYYNAQLTAVVLAFLPLSAGLTLIYTPILKSISQRAFLARAEQSSVLIDSLKGIDAVKAAAAERSVRWRWEDRYVKELRIGLYGTRVGVAFGAAGSVIELLGSTFILWHGAGLVMAGDLTVGQLMAFNAMVGNVTGPILGLIGLWPQVQEARVALDRLNDVYETPVERSRHGPVVGASRAQGRVVFDKVFFRYGAGAHEPYVLKGIDLQAQVGMKVAIVGRSGAGKTTLVKLIPRMFDPSEGVVQLDGSDVRDLEPGWLRRQMGLVLQEPFMFSGTITENIAPGVEEADLERVRDVAGIADAHGFVSDLPMGYETRIGEQGMGLSGGQQQRLAIARALYHDPAVLILDEATNALDTDSERSIQTNLDRVLSDRTAFIIAHRLSTVCKADLIVVLHRGSAVESGDHDALMGQGGFYAQLCCQQTGLA